MNDITTAQWWDPMRPERRLHGVLRNDKEHGWRLRLDGSFEEIPNVATESNEPVSVPFTVPDDYPVLLGHTSEGRLMTLFHCSILRTTLLGWPNAFMEISPTIIVHDVHFSDSNDFRLTSLSIRFSNMDAWTCTSGFGVEFEDLKRYSVCVRYTLPEPIEVRLPNGLVIGVDFFARGPALTSPLTEVNITQRVRLTISSPEPWRYDDLLRTSVVLANFLTLGIGQAVRPLEFWGSHVARAGEAGVASSGPFQIVHNYEPLAPERPDVHIVDMIFTLRDIRERLEDLLQSWFERQEHIGPLYELYFATIRSPKMYVEHRFLNMFQALESYDRQIYTHPPKTLQAHQERRDRILNAVSSQDKKWLARQLRHSHEPTAADRLRRLVNELDAEWLFDDVFKDIELAATLRNYRTHFDRSLERRLPERSERPLCMYNLAVRLQMLCELALLHEAGFSSQEIRQRMEATQRLQRRLGR